MLLIVIILMVLSSIIFLCFARNRRSLLIFLMTASLALFITSILIYVAKKGGIANETSLLLFGFSSIRNIMQYLPLTLGQLGYLVALGRFIFPLILIINALDFSYFDFAVRMRKKAYIFAVLPIISLVLYIPKIFESLVNEFKDIDIIEVHKSRFSDYYTSIIFSTDNNLSNLQGTIKWICKSPFRKDVKRKNWFISIY